MPHQSIAKEDIAEVSELNFRIENELLGEVILADFELLMQAAQAGLLVTVNKGSLLKYYQKDWLEQSTSLRILNNKKLEFYCIELNRNGIYHKLPEILFLKPYLGESNSLHTDIMEDLKKIKEVEKGTKDFFVPIDSEFVYQKAALHKSFGRWPFNLSEKKFGSIMQSFKDKVQGIDFNIFAYINSLKECNQIKNNPQKIETFLSQMSGHECKVSTEFQTEAVRGFSLGNAYLGINSAVGAKIKSEVRDYKVKVIWRRNEQFNNQDLKNRLNTFIQTAMNLFIPMTSTTRIEFCPSPESGSSSILSQAVVGENFQI